MGSLILTILLVGLIIGWASKAVGCSSSDGLGPGSLGSKVVNCQDEVSSRAAPVAVDFGGGVFDAPEVSGDKVTGRASAVVGGTKVSFAYQCTVDESTGTVIGVITDLPA